ncbi:MAG: ketopantoate reductase family protein [Pseudomonadota bacterium]
MKIAVMGAGALGCYFGGRIVEGGGDVAFIARGPHLKALQNDGLRIESQLGDAHLTGLTATDDPAAVGPVDLILFMVKLFDAESAARAMAPMIGPNTAVACFQNGVTAPRILSEIVGAERVIPGSIHMPAEITAPGVMTHTGALSMITFGEVDGVDSARCSTFADTLRAGGVTPNLSDDIWTAIWEKFVLLSSISAICGLTRLKFGPITADPLTSELLKSAVRETLAVAHAEHPGLPEGAEERAFATIDSLPPHANASMLNDLNAGRRIELMHLSGEVSRLGKVHGIPTPTHDVAVAALHAYVDGPPA